jgi:hypothetical protein
VQRRALARPERRRRRGRFAPKTRRLLVHLAPLAGRGRRAAPGEGASPRVRTCGDAPHPTPLPARGERQKMDPPARLELIMRHKQKARAGGPGFFWNGNVRFCDQKPRKNAGSGGRLEQLGRIGLDGLDGFSCNPLGQFGELLGVGRQGLELLAGMRRPQLHRFRG